MMKNYYVNQCLNGNYAFESFLIIVIKTEVELFIRFLTYLVIRKFLVFLDKFSILMLHFCINNSIKFIFNDQKTSDMSILKNAILVVVVINQVLSQLSKNTIILLPKMYRKNFFMIF
jgi:hypothetical protein